MWKKIRILILLFILATVALSTWRAQMRVTSWKSTLHVAVFPLQADDSASSSRYIQGLSEDHFLKIAEFLNDEAERYKLPLIRPVSIELGPQIAILPPLPPRNGNALQNILWSLQMRFWAWRNTPKTAVRPDIRLYVAYHDPALTSHVPHSIGLSKGQIGLIHAYAARQMNGENSFVITHELLHTLGATDKYDLATGIPIFPEGYAEPERQPRYPQRWAEIMGGKILLDPDRVEMPKGLGEAIVGAQSAMEIGWSKAAEK